VYYNALREGGMVNIGDPGIDGVVWDEWNLDHIVKHGVSRAEVEEVIDLGPVFQQAYKGRALAIGPTQSGRVLAVVLGPVPDQPGTFYVFSARPASRKERRHFQTLRGDGQR
ncbi:MAG: hypothetical protein ACRDJH_09955, partial [Thermomicrobiales bacterium]